MTVVIFITPITLNKGAGKYSSFPIFAKNFVKFYNRNNNDDLNEIWKSFTFDASFTS